MKPKGVHPAAELFPMMSEEELANLAQDIKANGLIHPIILDAANQLIDGRNRYAACQLAGVEPTFEQLNGQDPLAYIVSANLNRREMTKGQKAMALAMIYPDPERGRGKKDPARIKEPETVSFTRIKAARQVLHYSLELARAVLRGGDTTLDDALAKVRAEQQQASGNEARMERLRKCAPDLADLVAEERMSLTEATAAWMKRDEERRAVYQRGISAAEQIADFTAHVFCIRHGHAVRTETDPPIVIRKINRENIRAAYEMFEKFCEESDETQSKR